MNFNNKQFRFDNKGRSIALFVKNKFFLVNKKIIKFLKYQSKKNNFANVRICLHKNKKDKLHDMIVLINKKNKVLIHKHVKKDEIYQILEGKIMIEIFQKNKVKKIILDKRNNIIFRMKMNTFHRISPISNCAIFHEIRLGPLNKKDTIFKNI